MITHPNVLDLPAIKKQLNNIQYSAVIASDGPQLILAGAGSGKTRVLTYKIATLLSVKDIFPSQIMAVTFTNKAAAEMKNRVESILEESLTLKWLGTFHSVCAKILRMYGEHIGYQSNFTIYDREDQKRFIKRLLQAEKEPEQGITPDLLRFKVSEYKNNHQAPKEIRQDAGSIEEERMGYLYMQYQSGLLKNNAMDFDDLIFQTYLLLKSNREIKEKFNTNIKYILIDEFQDTNKTQFELVRLLLGPHKNITVVGDEDQSIYGWRGADIQNILSFQKFFPKVNTIKLEQNYRSTANILGVASSVIKNNRERLGKTIFTKNLLGEPVILKEHLTDLDEARWIVLDILADNEYLYGDTSIFYRTNAQSRVFEDQLRANNIPYVIVGGIRFYDRKEVKDIIAYLNVLNNSKDSVSLGRIINVPKRGIGAKTIEHFADIALENNITLMEALKKYSEFDLKPVTVRKIMSFVELIIDLGSRAEESSITELVGHVIEKSGYRNFLEDDGSSESLDRLANIEELVSAASEFTERNPDSGLEEFLNEISLLTQGDNNTIGNQMVTLMTVHSAKGLEFSKVFVSGLEEGMFPLFRQGNENIEEERRLFYVAVTRARKILILSHCQSRRIWGRESHTAGSRFLNEIDPKFIKTENIRPLLNYESGALKSSIMETENLPEYEEFSDEQPYYIGRSVYHGKYGEGTIIKTEGYGDDARVTVKFLDMERKLVVKYAKLTFFDD